MAEERFSRRELFQGLKNELLHDAICVGTAAATALNISSEINPDELLSANGFQIAESVGAGVGLTVGMTAGFIFSQTNEIKKNLKLELSRQALFSEAAKKVAKVFGVAFGTGVVTPVVMEIFDQSGKHWSEVTDSRLYGEIFRAVSSPDEISSLPK